MWIRTLGKRFGVVQDERLGKAPGTTFILQDEIRDDFQGQDDKAKG
ncbi:hypothetical protein [Leminorella richardii]|nr:hypothetical protein [Leminorella richardii]